MEDTSRFIKQELTQRQLIDLFRDVRKGFVKWHSHNDHSFCGYKWIEDGESFRMVPEDPFVAMYLEEIYHYEKFLDALRAIRHGRVTEDADPYREGYAVAIMNYRETDSMEWGHGADWETCYLLYEDDEYESDPWVFISWDGYP